MFYTTLIVTPFYFFMFVVACLPFVVFAEGFIFPPNLVCYYFVKFRGCFFELFITNISPSALTNKGYDITGASVI
jgi:hypothetical protein